MELAESAFILNIILGICMCLFLASLVYIATRSINWLPYPVALLFLGMFLSLFPIAPLEAIRLTPGTVLFIFLPIILFESAYNFEFKEFRRILTPGFLLATIGLLISTAIVGGVLHLFFNIPVADAMLFGSIISSTDPVAVLSIFKRLGVPKRLALLVDGESFLNDATSVVMFKILLPLTAASAFAANNLTGLGSIVSSGIEFVYVIAGGVIVGLVLGVIFSEIISLVSNISVVETTLSIILASLVFLIAEHYLQVSGIIAVLAAGLTLGNYGRTKFSPSSTKNMEEIWEFLLFLVIGLVFILVGYEIELVFLWENLTMVLAVLVSLFVGRAIAVYGLGLLTNQIQQESERLPLSWLHVAYWGGLRGVLPLVIVLLLPDTYGLKELFLTLVLGAVFFSFLLNATTLNALIRWLGLDKPNNFVKIETKITEIFVYHNLLAYLQKLKNLQEIGSEVYQNHLQEIRGKLQDCERSLQKLCSKCQSDSEQPLNLINVVKGFALHLEKATYRELFHKEIISEEIYLRLRNSLSTQMDGLASGSNQELMRTDIKAKLAKMRRLRKTIKGWLMSLFGNSFERNVADTYRYYKARMLGDEKVLTELNKFKFSELKIIGAQTIHKVEAEYQEFFSYNLETLDYLKSRYPQIILQVEEEFYDKEASELIKKSLRNFGEEGIISNKALNEFSNLSV